METRTRYQNIILVILAAITVVFGVLLAYNRTQSGIQFRDGFLKQEIRAENTVYYGHCEGEDVAIYVTEKTDGTLVQILAGERKWEYIVSSWTGGTEMYPGDRPVVISDVAGEELFRGYIGSSGHLFNESHNLDWESSGVHAVIRYDGADEWGKYTPPKLVVAELAEGPEIIHRGSIGLFILMLIATLCVAVDVLFPAFWFQVEHMFSVRNPEPSDFYIAMQRLSWAVSPVLLAVGYGYAAMMLP